MASNSQQPKERDGVISALDAAILVINLAKDTCGIPPAQIAFGCASVLLTTIRDSMANKQDYVDLGLSCASICKALDRGLDGRRLDELSQSVLGAIEELTTTVAGIQRKMIKRGNRNAVSRVFHAKDDKDTIVTWRQDLNRILQVFNTELLINNHTILLDIRRNALADQDSVAGGVSSTQTSVLPGELPPPPPRACFGRDELIEKIVSYAQNLEPTALIGAGGIGKTSIALSVLHHDLVKKRFGDNRRFIRCDQFPASRSHFLARLSGVIGAGVENPEDLTLLRPFLSTKEIFIVLDNAESILDPQGVNAREVYALVDELCQFKTISLCITSRITTVPRYCKRPAIPTLSMEAACDIFYGIYGDGGPSVIVDDLLRRLDFHALSITLLATTASHNIWDYDRLAEEWDTHRAQVLRTDHNESLAATIELSLASPTFTKLGPDGRDLLGVVAFFPQGVDEKNLGWLFPTISERKNVFDKFCALSLAYRSSGFITMLAPLRDYLKPQDPRSSPLLCATKNHYFTRMSVFVNPTQPGFGEARWIASEDVNVEHLLDIFTSIDAYSDDVWVACIRFMQHIYWHKPRQSLLGPKIENLPDSHPHKPRCLTELSILFQSAGNYAEQKRILTSALTLWRERGDDNFVAITLRRLSEANSYLGFHEEGMEQVMEAQEIHGRLGDTIQQAFCLKDLAWSLFYNYQPDAAGDAASRAIDLAQLEKGQEFLICEAHRVLGHVNRAKGKREEAIRHHETALEIASPFNWHESMFWNHYCLAKLFLAEDGFDDASVHIERAKSRTFNNLYNLGRATEVQADIWYRQQRLGDAKSEVLRALEIFETIGATNDVGGSMELLQKIEGAMESSAIQHLDESVPLALATSSTPPYGQGNV